MLKTSDKGFIFDAHQKLFLFFQVLKTNTKGVILFILLSV
jgi:hypothetical protein